MKSREPRESSRRLWKTAAVTSGTLFDGCHGTCHWTLDGSASGRGAGWEGWGEGAAVQVRVCVCVCRAEKGPQTGHGGFFFSLMV